ncbi:MAG: hypothetical protein B0D92_03750 [Spirochaeta sp. LUC14_002_19_P3]|nr:MAG: hypothetical protein B0D92_03750 [Spirochaeta sp. LUC14_002_19_P3]
MSKKPQKHSSKSRLNNQRNIQFKNDNKLSVELTRKEIRISSPIPPVEIMKEYEGLVPNATERFLRLAETQSEHRQKLELNNEKGQRRRAMLGLIAAWSITVLVIIVGGYLNGTRRS